MNRPLRRAAAPAAVAALVLGAATSSHADVVAHADARGDVVVVSHDDAVEAQTQAVAPDVRQGDIRRAWLDHRARSVVFVARFAELARGEHAHVRALRLRTPELVRDVSVVVDPGGEPQGGLYFTDRRGRPRPCSGVESRIDWVDDRVRIVVPRSCLRRPPWVRAGFTYFRVTPRDVLYADEAYRSGGVGTDGPTLGPQVHH